jgi:hypothetical protein
MVVYETVKGDVEVQADYYITKASGRGVKVVLD